jgi:hypothetical protein
MNASWPDINAQDPFGQLSKTLSKPQKSLSALVEVAMSTSHQCALANELRRRPERVFERSSQGSVRELKP